MKAVLLKPLDGHPIGATLEFSQIDFDHLVGKGAVKAAPVPTNKAAPTPDNKGRK